MLVADVTGDLSEIIGNEERLYEGDLSLYFRILYFESSDAAGQSLELGSHLTRRWRGVDSNF